MVSGLSTFQDIVTLSTITKRIFTNVCRFNNSKSTINRSYPCISLEREHVDKMTTLIFKCLQIVLLLVLSGRYTIAEKETQHSKRTYIIHMDKFNMPASFNDHLQWYDSSLKSVSNSAEMLYIYKHAAHGFSTRLTTQEAESLEKQPGILSVIPDVKYELHTTRTPEFLGLLEKTSTPALAYAKQSEVVVGILDTGVWPELKSFDDTGLGPVPSSWKGACERGNNFNSSNCNKKLVGARFFSKGYEAAIGPINEETESKSPRDDDGHGSHTSTTAAGSAVPGASLLGFASGTARGMATQARVATYKVCWLGGCFTSDIVAGIDSAIQDGVNILSKSIGGGLTDYYRDIVAAATFAATAHGILVSSSAGNSGPDEATVSNVAPWTITVGAGTIDRDFPAYITLGNGKRYTGVSLYRGKPLDSPVPVVYASNVSSSSSGNQCTEDSLIPSKVSGKVVICDRGGNPRVEKGLVVKKAGGVGMILANTEMYGEELVADSFLIPAAALGQKSSNEVKKYVFSVPNPTVKIAFGGTQLGVQPSPVVAAFSSRGPNLLTPKMLKPDLIAPGVNILAGWTGKVGPSGLSVDTRHVSFNIVSGTSMSCPHVTGLAALLKGAHPEWSPAAIRSALMTTSYTTYKNGQPLKDIATGLPATPFDYGAGHIHPAAAFDPGLVYDATVDDYLSFFCALNYTSPQIKLAAKREFTCDKRKKYRVEDLNYPSFAVPFDTTAGIGSGSSATSTVQYKRTLTNVGSPATYKASVSSQSPWVKILVEPPTLSFRELNEKKSYTVTFTSSAKPSGTTSFAHLEWSDGKHSVVSPIAFSWT